MKTLVLRASAEEDHGEYKIHLVPCFQSHIDAANALFRARFGTKEEGGLLYWIGEREHLVDYDKEMSPLPAVSEERIKSFRLTDLAAILGCPTQTAKTA